MDCKHEDTDERGEVFGDINKNDVSIRWEPFCLECDEATGESYFINYEPVKNER